MSSERRDISRRQIRQPPPQEPFLEAEPDSDPDPLHLPALTLEALEVTVVTGFAGLHRRFDALEPRVQKLEADAAWKRWALRVLKALGPFAAGAIASRFPELAKHLPAILEALQ